MEFSEEYAVGGDEAYEVCFAVVDQYYKVITFEFNVYDPLNLAA